MNQSRGDNIDNACNCQDDDDEEGDQADVLLAGLLLQLVGIL